MKKTTVIVGVIVVLIIIAIVLIGSTRFYQKNDTNIIVGKVNSVNLFCSDGYSASAIYYSPNERGIMDKLLLEIKRDGSSIKYNMIPALSASGSKFETKDGVYSFWEHQGEFTFAQGEDKITVCRELPDATYKIEDKEVTLVGGVSEVAIPNSSAKIITRYFGNEVKGDFNKDGKEDTAFIITQNTGGSGTFYYLVVALGSENGLKGTNAILLGDRISPQTTNLEEKNSEIIVVNYADRKVGEAMVVQPSIGVSLRAKIVNGDLIKVTDQSN